MYNKDLITFFLLRPYGKEEEGQEEKEGIEKEKEEKDVSLTLFFLEEDVSL